MKPFEFLSHTADIKFQAYGKTLEEAFSNSALAVKASMTKDKIIGTKRKGLGVMGDDLESLLYNFLEEIIFLLESENFIIAEAENIEIEGNNEDGFSLKCDFVGDESEKYTFEEHVKAVTYNDMKIEKKKNGYEITVVLDV